jgi:hypothetical protein
MSTNSQPVKLVEQVTCPNCWQPFPPEKAMWIARHQMLPDDPRLGESHKERFWPDRFTVDCRAIDKLGAVCDQTACPHCRLEVPRECFEISPIFWSILGSPRCGKSYVLTSMVRGLRELLPGFCIGFNEVDTALNRTLTGYEDLLFNNSDRNKLVRLVKTDLEAAATQSTIRDKDGQLVTYGKPFMFKIAPLPQNPFAGHNACRPHVLCLYDNAGEDFLPGMRDDYGYRPAHHISRSKVLMFLFDPTQDSRFRDACRAHSQDPQVLRPPESHNQVAILNEVAKRVRRLNNHTADWKYDGLFLVVLTKVDVWRHLLGELSWRDPWHSSRHHASLGLDRAYVDEVSRTVRQLLFDRGLCRSLVGAAEAFAQHVVYLPISATGCSPEEDAEIGLGFRPRNLQPVWAELPVLYALHRLYHLIPCFKQSPPA